MNQVGSRLQRVEIPKSQQEPHQEDESNQQVTPIVGTTRTHPEQIWQHDTEKEQTDEPPGSRCHSCSAVIGGILPHTIWLAQPTLTIGEWQADGERRLMRKRTREPSVRAPRADGPGGSFSVRLVSAPTAVSSPAWLPTPRALSAGCRIPASTPGCRPRTRHAQTTRA